MRLIISGRGVVLTPSLRSLIERKVEKLARGGTPPLAVRVTCASQRFERTVRLVARARRRNFSCQASADHLLTAVEGAVDMLCRQMRDARTRRRRAQTRRSAAGDASEHGA
jgi:ribosomal subunit interface protein